MKSCYSYMIINDVGSETPWNVDFIKWREKKSVLQYPQLEGTGHTYVIF